MNSKNDQQSMAPASGYLEGYYGKLLSWNERHELLNFLASRQYNTYCYAPKEDIQHRLRWREPHGTQWHQSFAQFCQCADELAVSIVAGIAPGLDFKFDSSGSPSDFDHLLNKAVKFLSSGATEILVLWDDIDEAAFVDVNGLSEGTAHARIINQLSEKLVKPLWTVPRVYANDIENKNHYTQDFFAELQPQHTVLHCGNAIVASQVKPKDLTTLTCSSDNREPESIDASKHRIILWDNFYANDYCPRRLFVGPWTGREDISEYLLNPTGLPYTDKLLLDIAQSTRTDTESNKQWKAALTRHGVPDAFHTIAPYFSHPFFGDRKVLGDQGDIAYIEPTNAIEQAIDVCLWKWKSPLAREWYPFIFGLKHDLAISQHSLPRDRVLKTQPPALAQRLLN